MPKHAVVKTSYVEKNLLAIQILKVLFDCITDICDPVNTTGVSHLKVIYHVNQSRLRVTYRANQN